MTTNAEIDAAAAILVAANPNLSTEAATELAKAVIAASKEPTPPAATPAAPPPAPRLDADALANMTETERFQAWRAHEKALSEWVPIRQSYLDPISAEAQAAREQLLAMRAASEVDTDAEKSRRAMQREKLMETILAGGMARL